MVFRKFSKKNICSFHHSVVLSLWNVGYGGAATFIFTMCPVKLNPVPFLNVIWQSLFHYCPLALFSFCFSHKCDHQVMYKCFINEMQYKMTLTVHFVNPPQYSLAYAFLKLVNYSFFFWLPFYLNSALHWQESDADKLSTVYDVAGIVGKWDCTCCFCC